MAGTWPPPNTPPGHRALISGSPAGSTGESQQPAGEAQPPLTGFPLKSPSSATMKIALCGVQARLDMIVPTADLTNASAFLFSCASFGSSFALPNGHGVSGWPGTAVNTPPCMSLHWSGLMNTNRGGFGPFRSPARAEYGLMFATLAGSLRMSENRTNGLCLEAYSGVELDGQKSASGLSAGSASM